jgi:hypothetical protein
VECNKSRVHGARLFFVPSERCRGSAPTGIIGGVGLDEGQELPKFRWRLRIAVVWLLATVLLLLAVSASRHPARPSTGGQSPVADIIWPNLVDDIIWPNWVTVEDGAPASNGDPNSN